MTAFHRSTFRQLFLYAMIGGVQLLADWMCFVLLTWLAMDVIPANLLARISGAILGFLLNGRYTFAQRTTSPRLDGWHLARFTIGWMLTAVLSTGSVWLIDNLGGIDAARLGKLVIDTLLALFGFILSKYWIFR